MDVVEGVVVVVGPAVVGGRRTGGACEVGEGEAEVRGYPGGLGGVDVGSEDGGVGVAVGEVTAGDGE